MIYAVCATQLITVFVALFALRWCLSYLRERDAGDHHAYEFYMTTAVKLAENGDRSLRALVDEFGKERERLLERIQHPETTQGQAMGVGRTPSVFVADEEHEANEEFPDEVLVNGGENNGSTSE